MHLNYTYLEILFEHLWIFPGIKNLREEKVMDAKFNPEQLKRVGANTSRPRSERLFVKVTEFDLPDNAPHRVRGVLIGTDKEVVVRLNSIDEQMGDSPKSDRAAVEKQYAGENARKSIQSFAKDGIRLIAFDNAVSIGEGEYRAHWANTMSTKPEAEVFRGLAHIKLHRPSSGKTRAYTEILHSAEFANAENIIPLLTGALTIKDAEGRARDPHAILRFWYQNKPAEGEVRLFPSSQEVKSFDQAKGVETTIRRRVEAHMSLADLFADSKSGIDNIDAQRDAVRAVVAALKGESLPVPVYSGKESASQAANLYQGIQGGFLQVEVIAAERIDFGQKTTQSYINEDGSPNWRFTSYVTEKEDGGKTYKVPGYADTVLTFLRYDDGEPFGVFASPADQFPKPVSLNEVRFSEPEAPAPAPASEANDEMAPTA
jgi:hypothetical protein